MRTKTYRDPVYPGRKRNRKIMSLGRWVYYVLVGSIGIVV